MNPFLKFLTLLSDAKLGVCQDGVADRGAEGRVPVDARDFGRTAQTRIVKGLWAPLVLLPTVELGVREIREKIGMF